MTAAIELNDRPASLSPRARRNAMWQVVGLTVAFIATVIVVFPEQLARGFAALGVPVIGGLLGMYVSLMSRQTVRIVPGQSIAVSSALPDLLRHRSSDWSVPLNALTGVTLEARMAAPAGYRLLFHTRSDTHRVKLFGWFRADAAADPQPMPRKFIPTHDDFIAAARTSPLVAALGEAGIAVDLTPTKAHDGLKLASGGRAVAGIAIAAIVVAVVALLFDPLGYLGQPPWLLIAAAALLGAGAAHVSLAGADGLSTTEARLAPVMLGICIGVAVWAGAPRVAVIAGAELEDRAYRHDGDGVFIAVEQGPPTLTVGRRVGAHGGWERGDGLQVPVVRVLGTWVYDRVETRRRLRAGPPD